jgi:hypothetical protein|tara:strand:+ start:4131 stop:4337 length:207 start_codon:yes stop_codon:yes gene_type:complete
MNEKLNLIENFRIKLKELSNEYPNHRQSIIESSTIVYVNWQPTFNFSKYLKDEEIKDKIQTIFNELVS